MAKTKGKKKSQAAATSRKPAILSIAALALVAGGSLLALFGRRLRPSGGAEHAAPDLALDKPHPGPNDRAPEAFRPDPTAPVPAGERDGLRPATGPKPRLVATS
jgi:hypothetical protein